MIHLYAMLSLSRWLIHVSLNVSSNVLNSKHAIVGNQISVLSILIRNGKNVPPSRLLGSIQNVLTECCCSTRVHFERICQRCSCFVPNLLTTSLRVIDGLIQVDCARSEREVGYIGNGSLLSRLRLRLSLLCWLLLWRRLWRLRLSSLGLLSGLHLPESSLGPRYGDLVEALVVKTLEQNRKSAVGASGSCKV